MSSEGVLSPQESRAEAQRLIEWLRTLSRQRLNSSLADDRRAMAPFAVLELSRNGLLGMTSPKDLGGAGLLPGDALRVLRQLSAIDLSLALLTGLHNFLSSAPLLAHASEAVKEQWASSLVSGSRLASFALTEEGAGSDPRRMSALAEEQEDGSWIITGKKIWSGAAAWAGIALVFAQTRLQGGQDKGISAFAVPLDDPAVIHGTEARTMGLRAVVQSEIIFEGVKAPSDHLVGAVGRGLEVAQSAMMRCRLVCSVFAAGAMMRSLQLAWRYASRRTIATGLMAENPVAKGILQEESLRAHALNLFLEWNFEKMDRGEEISPLVYLASKVVGPEEGWLTVDACLQLLGGRGYMEENVVSRMLRDVRVLRIFEGPTEALASHLGSLAGSRPAELKALLESVEAADVWAGLEPLVEKASVRAAREEGADRDELLRRQHRAGMASAFGIYLAVVRRQAETEMDREAAAWLESRWSRQLEAPFTTPTFDFSSHWEDLTGQCEETKLGDHWTPDPQLR